MACSGAETPLRIERAALAQMEDGSPLPADSKFAVGETVFFSCRVSGYGRKGDEPPKVKLSWSMEARDPKGALIVPAIEGKIEAELAPEDKNWQPKIGRAIELPPLADAGTYRIVVKVRDEFGKQEAELSTPVAVRARAVEPSDSLTVRNFRFLRSEDDRDPLAVAAYRPGESVWARFDMTGYRLAEKNRFDIEYGLTVLRPDGGVTYREAKAAAEKDESFYRRRYTPGILSLTLPKDLAKGQYEIVLEVRDNADGAKFEMRRKFSVE